jgi:microcystin degradation protein MlrC
MVTDLGGFAAATFKRGINFINIPTTLLAMVDAAVGGKTGINFCGLKNEIGAFREANAVVVDTNFLNTLDTENLRSGYAEMLKHALLSNAEMWSTHLNFDFANVDLLSYEIVVVKLGYLFTELKPFADRELFALSDGASCVELERLGLKNIIRPMFPLDEFEFDPYK